MWSCDYCQSHKEGALQRQRRCPFLAEEDFHEKHAVYNEAELNKYAFKKLKRKKEEKQENSSKSNRNVVLQVLDYQFFECPIGLLIEQRGLTSLVDLINWSADMNTPLFEGGLDRYSNWFYECYRTVINEQRMIEHEEMKKHRQKDARSANEASTRGLGKTATRSRRR